MALDFTTSLIKLNNQYTIVGTSEDIAEDAVPKKGELYFLPIDGGQRVCKIGDGETPFGELPQIGVETATASTYGTAMASSTSPVMDGTASVGTETTKFARGDHKHPTDTSRAPTNHASSASTYGLGTTSNYGHVKISNGDVATVSSANGLVAGMNHSHSDLAPSGHTHDISIATSTATSELTLAHGSTYQLTAGGESFVFKMPTDNNTTYSVAKYNSLGLLKPAYTSTGAATLSTAAASNATTPIIASKTTTSGRYYGVEADKNGVLFVNVPWTDSNTDTKVAGTNTATSTSEFPIFFKNSTGETTTAANARFNTGFTFIPGNSSTHTNLKITSAGKSVQLDLHRDDGCGYIVNNGGGEIGICAGVTSTAMADSVLFTGTSVYPGTTNVQSLGTSTYKWSNVYATTFTGALSGNATTATTATKVSTSLTFNNGGSGAASGTTFNGSAAKTISYNTIGAAAASHTHGNVSDTGTITSTAVTSATGLLVYDSNNKIQRATAANARTIIGAASSGHTHTTLVGTYTQNGGKQPPSYVGANAVKCNMMNGFLNTSGGTLTSFSSYADVLMMNAYIGSDVPYVTALAINKNSTYPRAWIANGGYSNTTGWNAAAELWTNANLTFSLSGTTLTITTT